MRITMRSVYKDGPIMLAELYSLLKEREGDTSSNISHTGLPPWDDHVRFVRSRPYRIWHFVLVDGLPAGSVYLTKLNEVGIHIRPDYRGKGIGTWALTELVRRFKPLPGIPAHRIGRFLANIHPDNERSARLFQSMGFVLLQQTYAL